ncbi:MAG: peptidoglycan DD-metalloendopeptidase family protein [Alphaproteobacteria bacterium]
MATRLTLKCATVMIRNVLVGLVLAAILTACVRTNAPAPVVDRTLAAAPPPSPQLSLAERQRSLLTPPPGYGEPGIAATSVARLQPAVLRTDPAASAPSRAAPRQSVKVETLSPEPVSARPLEPSSPAPVSVRPLESASPPAPSSIGTTVAAVPQPGSRAVDAPLSVNSSPHAHVVRRGETLYGVSQHYGVEVDKLADLNGMTAPYTLHVGQSLRLPAATSGDPESESSPSAPMPAPRSTKIAATSIGEPPPRTGDGFAWPVEGRVVSTFGTTEGGRRNDGLNIAAPRGAPVQASENGVVAYAGSEIRGFGNLVLVKHEGGLITAYAHNEALLVERGDVVRKGQVIARVGESGSVETPQLHFEIRRGTTAIDPHTLLTRG